MTTIFIDDKKIKLTGSVRHQSETELYDELNTLDIMDGVAHLSERPEILNGCIYCTVETINEENNQRSVLYFVDEQDKLYYTAKLELELTTSYHDFSGTVADQLRDNIKLCLNELSELHDVEEEEIETFDALLSRMEKHNVCKEYLLEAQEEYNKHIDNISIWDGRESFVGGSSIEEFK